MSAILYGIGGLAFIFGVALAGFGIPVSEFSFGNTLIMSGATVGACGLIVIALAAVTAQLQRLNDLLGHGALVGAAHETYDAQPAVSEPHPFEPRGPAAPPEFPMPAAPAPALRNPEEPPQVEEEEASLSPEQAAPMAAANEPAKPAERTFDTGWPRQRPAAAAAEPPSQPRQRSTFFDSMWPPENKMLERPADEAEASRPAEPAEPEAPPAPEFAEAAPPPPAARAEEPKPRAIAILKSGVVDGMSYTLYVDGSIEAELPQGTLRFASIHELRAHLEKNG
jgi:hypothetical protein